MIAAPAAFNIPPNNKTVGLSNQLQSYNIIDCLNVTMNYKPKEYSARYFPFVILLHNSVECRCHCFFFQDEGRRIQAVAASGPHGLFKYQACCFMRNNIHVTGNAAACNRQLHGQPATVRWENPRGAKEIQNNRGNIKYSTCCVHVIWMIPGAVQYRGALHKAAGPAHLQNHPPAPVLTVHAVCSAVRIPVPVPQSLISHQPANT